MTEQTEQPVDEAGVAQDAPAEKPAPEVAVETAAAPDPAAAPPEAPSEAEDQGPDVLGEHPPGSIRHYREGIAAGPADHPRLRKAVAPPEPEPEV